MPTGLAISIARKVVPKPRARPFNSREVVLASPELDPVALSANLYSCALWIERHASPEQMERDPVVQAKRVEDEAR